jgi:hypothetical protein
MAISKEAYSVLESIVGTDYITDDPILCEGYRSGPGGYEAGTGYERVITRLRRHAADHGGSPEDSQGLYSL